MAEIPVRVEVDRSGGFAGITVHSEADTATLPPADAEELRRAVSQADLAQLVPRLSAARPAGGRPDGFQYDVTVREGPESYQFTVYDGAIPPEVRPLLALTAGRAGKRP